MTRADQKKFIRELTRSVAGEIIGRITTGKVPKEWDGNELRELLYEKFEFERTRMMAGPGPQKSRRRTAEYRKAVLMNNL